MITSMLSIILLAAPLPIARAAPWRTLYSRQSNGNGNPNNNNSGFSSSVWIPVVIIGGLLLICAVLLFRKNMMARRADASETEVSNGADSTTASQTRELTAADLTGGTRAARRQRRPRRTPSQISTRSLPAYMKEPGDNEVVIYRGLDDMDEETEEPPNVQNPTTGSTDTTLDPERTDRGSHDDTRALLPFRTDSPELVRHSPNVSRGSYDQQGSDDSHSRLIDVRGEAPAYETIELTPTEPAPAHSRQNSQSARMSGFFNRFMPNRNSGTMNEPPTRSPPPDSRNSTLSLSHSRDPSAQSGISGAVSADFHDSPRRSTVGRTHRNGSTTGSVFSFFSKTGSGNNDDGPMTSPSMISLNSISSPLTYTATRTEFAFPRTGPTSEQVKFLSSKETFSRFGVPYGPDAVAFAASSRPDLPPDFDSVHRVSISDLTPDDSGTAPSLRRSSSTRRMSTDANSDRAEFPTPASAEPSPDLDSLADQVPLSRRRSGPSLELNTTLPLQLSKQKSTPNLGMGHPSLLKSVLKSKSMVDIQGDEEGSLTPRSVSAGGSYLTIESFQTAHDDRDGPVPSPAPGLVPQIMVQLPSNNPSLVNLAEGSGSETEEFFDGEEGVEGNAGKSINRRGIKSATPGNHIKGSQTMRTYTLASDSDDENEADTHSSHTEVNKNLASRTTVIGA